jgi:geranylgeranyl diphosphate synthase, type III
MEPYEYIQSLPGKNTLVKFIDALQMWLRLPIYSLDIVKGISVMLFNSTLMLV